jgi:hypothetical protein
LQRTFLPSARAERLVRSGAVVLQALVAIACGSDEDTSESVAPDGPPILRIDELRSAGYGVFRPDSECIPIGKDDEGTVVVQLGETAPGGLELENWTFRPYGGCKGLLQCGLVSIEVTREGDAERAHLAAATAVSVPIPFAELGPGRYTITVQLINDQGVPFFTDGGVSSASATIDVRSTCEALPDAGSPGGDGGADAAVPDGAVPDGGVETDGAVDSGADSGDGAISDAGLDSPPPGPDASVGDDAGRDASSEAPDGGADAGGVDASVDAPMGG